MSRSETNQLLAGVVFMMVASESWDWGTLTSELREQLVPFLPLEIKDLISSADRPSVHDLRTIHARLEHLWRSISAMAPRWIVDSVGDPASTCLCAAEATLLFADVT